MQGKIVSKDLVNLYKQPQVINGLDEVVLAPLAKGYGFMYEKNPLKPVSFIQSILNHQCAPLKTKKKNPKTK